MIIYPERFLEPRTTPTRGRVEVFFGRTGHNVDPTKWFWRTKGKNGQKTGSGGESFTRRQGAVDAVDRLLSAQLTGNGIELDASTGVFTQPGVEVLVVPWHLVVFNRDGSVYREGLVY